MTTFVTKIYGWITSIQPITWMVVVVVLILMGLMFLLPIKKLNDFAKEHIVLMIIGAFLVFAAVEIGQDMATSAGFYSGTGARIEDSSLKIKV